MATQRKTQTITLVVTHGDLENGKPRSACFCPIARALKRIVKDGCAIYVIPDSVNLNRRAFWADDSCNVPLPASLMAMLVAIDHGENVRPGEFEIPNFPVEFIRAGAIV
jgi:hypothetical protein